MNKKEFKQLIREELIKEAKGTSYESKLAEIEKQGKIVTLEAKIDALAEMIEAKTSRLSLVSEDENLAELIDKKKIKEMQKEIKLLEKQKAKMEKMYEKMGGVRTEVTSGDTVEAGVEEGTDATYEEDDTVTEGIYDAERDREEATKFRLIDVDGDEIMVGTKEEIQDWLWEETEYGIEEVGEELEESSCGTYKEDDIKEGIYMMDGDDVNAILSDGGYDTIDDPELLDTVVAQLQEKGIEDMGVEELNDFIMSIEDDEGGNIYWENQLNESKNIKNRFQKLAGLN